MVPSTLATHYAKAVLNVMGGAISYDMIKDIEKAYCAFIAHPDAISYLAGSYAPGYDVVLLKFLSTFKLDVILKPLVEMLARQKRLSLIGDVLYALSREYKQRNGIISVNVKSASALTDDQKKFLEAYLTKHVAKQFEIIYHIDSSLIAGIRIELDSQLWEHSVAKEMRSLRLRLLGGSYGH